MLCSPIFGLLCFGEYSFLVHSIWISQILTHAAIYFFRVFVLNIRCVYLQSTYVVWL